MLRRSGEAVSHSCFRQFWWSSWCVDTYQGQHHGNSELTELPLILPSTTSTPMGRVRWGYAAIIVSFQPCDDFWSILFFYLSRLFSFLGTKWSLLPRAQVDWCSKMKSFTVLQVKLLANECRAASELLMYLLWNHLAIAIDFSHRSFSICHSNLAHFFQNLWELLRNLYCLH